MGPKEFLTEIAKRAISKRASDIHLKPGNYPVLRVDGELQREMDFDILKVDFLQDIVSEIVPKKKWPILEEKGSVDFALGLSGVGRFRVNVFRQRGSYAVAMRYIPFEVPPFEELNLPEVILKLALEKRGLILVTGITGSGKSTTLASMLKYIASNRNVNIITLEDPIEYLLKDDLAIISQRELGDDFDDFASALKFALRQDPDVIMVGEMRDLETIRTAILAAETGHLVLSTLHTLDAPETINRIISVFPSHEQEDVRYRLAGILRAIISQRLIPKLGGGRVPACEILINTAAVRECIIDPNRLLEVKALMEKGKEVYGMQTFDQSLLDLYNRGLISLEDTLGNATNPDDLLLKIKGISQVSGDVTSSGHKIDRFGI
ncbi:MAG: type IV pilus twitching motility protein PilT [Thermosulfidibacteraceae bacterium]